MITEKQSERLMDSLKHLTYNNSSQNDLSRAIRLLLERNIENNDVLLLLMDSLMKHIQADNGRLNNLVHAIQEMICFNNGGDS